MDYFSENSSLRMLKTYYYRLNTPKHCFSTGYKDGATVQITATGPCSDVSITGQDDVIIHVFVNGHSVQVGDV